MNIFLDAHRIILEKLVEKKVDFMLIGGYAVNFYGYNRATADMDVWIKADNNNKLLLLEALAALDFEEEGIAEIKKWNFEEPQKFHLFEKPFQTEFLTHISGIKFSEARPVAIEATIDGIKLPVIHIGSLIKNKRSTGRTKDVADAEYLEKILNLRSKK